jgi:hypothetical protein
MLTTLQDDQLGMMKKFEELMGPRRTWSDDKIIGGVKEINKLKKEKIYFALCFVGNL